MQEVSLYDPNRKPPSWMGIIQPTQYAAFFLDVETGAEMTNDGRYLKSESKRACLIFNCIEEAERYCRHKVEAVPSLRCDVFDSEGRANPPVAIFVNRQHQRKLDSAAKARRMMRWACGVIVASFPLFWYAWHARGEAWIAAFLGVQVVLVGLRLLHWGYSMKEELQYRAVQSDLRLQQRVIE